MKDKKQIVQIIVDEGRISVSGNFEGDIIGLLERAKLAMFLQEMAPPAIAKPTNEQVVQLVK